MKKKILFGAIGVGLLALALWYIPAVEKIDRVMPAIEWQYNDESVCQPTELTIRGEYYRYLFREDYFIGTVSLSGYTLEPWEKNYFPSNEPITAWSDRVKILYSNRSLFTQLLLEWVGKPPSTDVPISFHVATGTLGDPRYNKMGCLRAENGRKIRSLVIAPGLEHVLFHADLPGSGFHYLSAPATTRDEAVQLQKALLPSHPSY